MKFAIIAESGKQYKVSEGQTLTLEKLQSKSKTVSLSHVLLIADGNKVTIGTPEISGAKIPAQVIEHGRSKKQMVIKFKHKVRYKRTRGHRQHFTKIKIGKIPTAK
ncbi:50S ribosomal protein L21 [Patescibacteria group bacterium]